MNPLIERRLGETARQLLLVRAIKSSAVVLCVTTAAVLLLGAIASLGYVASSGAAWGWFIVILVAGCLTWLMALLLNAVSQLAPEKLAHETERANPGLMDRLHTLVFLRPRRHVAQVESYAGRIEQQSAMLLFRDHTSGPLFNRDTVRWFAIWLVLLWSTILFYQWFRPFGQLGLAEVTPTVTDESPGLELPPTAKPQAPALDNNEEPWLEVRVSDPGQDIVATRFESVPLLVEAATSDELSQVKVRTAHNGVPRRDLSLPRGPDRRFVRQEALVDLKLRGARDWDVLSYHVTASSSSGIRAESPMYFIDVRPTQEKIEQLPGGAEGEAYHLLNDLTGMVSAQEDAIRAAHRQSQLPVDRVDSQALSDLAQAQLVMKRGVEYLADSLPDKKNLSSTTEQLRRAAEAFQRSAELLEDGQAKAGEEAAQRALGELAAARRQIHQAVQDDPSALPKPLIDSDPSANLAEQLQKHDELQNELRTAAEEAAKLAAEERRVTQQIQPRSNRIHRQAAERQQQLHEKFDKFRQQHAQACEQASGACSKAGEAVDKFTQALDQLTAQLNPASHSNANSAGAASADALQQLAQALQREATRQQNAAARQLQRALDRQIQFLEQVEDRPGEFTEQQLEQAAENMHATTDELKEMAEDPRTREQFSDRLRDELNDENKRRLDGQCQGICQNPGGSGRGQAAGIARSGLQRVRSAMQSRSPGPSGRSSSSNQLATDSAQALERARRQLQSLLRDANGGASNRDAQRELLRDALRNLRVGMAPSGRGQASNDLLKALEEQSANEQLPIDLELLRRIVGQLDRVQLELMTEHESDTKANVSHLDSQNYPPGYREWIQRYYRRLAEQQ